MRKGEKVAENDVVQVTELLMNELLKLDAVVADGDVKAQRRMQVSEIVAGCSRASIRFIRLPTPTPLISNAAAVSTEFESIPAFAVAGEARPEVRGDAGRGGSQERRHHPQVQREGRRQASTTAAAAVSSAKAPAAAAAAAAATEASAPPAAAGADAVGDVRPAVVAAIHVLGLVNDHRELHGVLRRAADEPPGLDALTLSATRHRPPATTSAKAAASPMWGESERASADAMLVCQELHPLPAHPARQKSGSSPDEAMIGFGQAGRQGYASFDHTTALRCMVPYQPILVHQSIIHVRVIFFFFFFFFCSSCCCS